MTVGQMPSDDDIVAPRRDAQWNLDWMKSDSPPHGAPYGHPHGDAQPPAQAAPPTFSGQPAADYYPQFAHMPPLPLAPSRWGRVDTYLRLVVILGGIILVGSFANDAFSRSVVQSQRDFIEIPKVEPAGAAGALPLDRAEEFATSYDPHRDAKGSYVASGQELTRAFGAELVWADLGVADPTTRCQEGSDNPDEVLAWYCSAEPYLIRLNRGSPAMPVALYDEGFIDSVKHELAHLAIHARCGDSQPAAGSVEVEGVTSSYAVLYLGADREGLGSLGSAYPAYAMTTRTDDVATWIHSGVCWYESGGT